jgi:hypothetical protein
MSKMSPRPSKQNREKKKIYTKRKKSLDIWEYLSTSSLWRYSGSDDIKRWATQPCLSSLCICRWALSRKSLHWTQALDYHMICKIVLRKYCYCGKMKSSRLS